MTLSSRPACARRTISPAVAERLTPEGGAFGAETTWAGAFSNFCSAISGESVSVMPVELVTTSSLAGAGAGDELAVSWPLPPLSESTARTSPILDVQIMGAFIITYSVYVLFRARSIVIRLGRRREYSMAPTH